MAMERVAVLQMRMRSSLGVRRTTHDYVELGCCCLMFLLCMGQAGSETVGVLKAVSVCAAVAWFTAAVLKVLATKPDRLFTLPPMLLEDARLLQRHLSEAIERANRGEDGEVHHAA